MPEGLRATHDVRKAESPVICGNSGGSLGPRAGSRGLVPSGSAGSDKQDLSSQCTVPTWLAQAVQQPWPDTQCSGSRPDPAQLLGMLEEQEAGAGHGSQPWLPLPCAWLLAPEPGRGSAGAACGPGRDLGNIAQQLQENGNYLSQPE